VRRQEKNDCGVRKRKERGISCKRPIKSLLLLRQSGENAGVSRPNKSRERTRRHKKPVAHSGEKVGPLANLRATENKHENYRKIQIGKRACSREWEWLNGKKERRLSTKKRGNRMNTPL